MQQVFATVQLITGRWNPAAQFGLTPQSRRSPDAGWLRGMWRDRLAKVQPDEITMFPISEVQESPAFNGRHFF
jgi:hypothetical protein